MRNDRDAEDADPQSRTETPDGEPRQPARTIFDVDAVDEREAERELRRMATRRIAVWGIATGAVMAGIVLICILLLFLASQGA